MFPVGPNGWDPLPPLVQIRQSGRGTKKKINKWTTVDLDTIQNIEKLQKTQTNYLNELLKMFIIIVIIAMTSRVHIIRA